MADFSNSPHFHTNLSDNCSIFGPSYIQIIASSTSSVVGVPPALLCCEAPEQKPVTINTQPQPRYSMNTGSTASPDPRLSTATSTHTFQEQSAFEDDSSDAAALAKGSSGEKRRKRDKLRDACLRLMKACGIPGREKEDGRPSTRASTTYSDIVNRVAANEGIDKSDSTCKSNVSWWLQLSARRTDRYCS